MADTKITDFAEITNLANVDVFPVVNDPSGTPNNKKITVKNIFGRVPANTLINGTFEANTNSIRVSTAQTPANSTANGTHGTISWDANYIYVVTANNVWKRVSLSSF